MKKIGILAGAFVVVGFVAFLFGYFTQAGKITAAQSETAACQTASVAQVAAATQTAGLLELYRARAEIARQNFGSAGDDLVKAKTLLAGEPNAEARAAIDKTTALVLKQEAAASYEIAAIIKSLESKLQAP